MAQSVADEPLDIVRRAAAARVPINANEATSIRRLLTELDRLPDPCSETADPVHVTGSAIVVGRRGVVLLRHKRLGLWLQPGGHIDHGETPWDAALRETIEETGLDADFADLGVDGVPVLAHVDVHPGGRGHTHLDLRYLVRADDDDPCPPDGESQEIGWFEWTAAIERASDARLTALLQHLADAGASRDLS